MRLRLTLAFALAMAVVLLGTGLFVYLRLGATLDEQIENGLRSRADDVAALVRGTDAGLGSGLADTEDSFAQVIGPDGRVRDATPGLVARPLLAGDLLMMARRSTIVTEREGLPGLDGARARLLATPVEDRGRTLVVVAGASLEDRDEALTSLLAQLLVGGPVALALASLLGYGLAAAALRPVEAMRRRAAEISATTTGRRLPVPRADDEVRQLAGTLNDMLDRLEAGFDRERRFVAEASHELRTPLALMRTELELALRRPRSAEELREAVASAAEETDRLARLADDLLVLARSDEGELGLSREPLFAKELLATVAHRFAVRAAQSGREVEVDAPAELGLTGDRLRLGQALGNLVDNALRHGGGVVSVSGRRNGEAVELHVTDQGPGLPPDFLPVAFERFSRPERSRSEGGAGLGLALAEAVAKAHGGTAHAVNLPGGGADVWLALPVQ